MVLHPRTLHNRFKDKTRLERAFTLIELVVVILIIGIASTLVAIRLNWFSFWSEEGFIRKLSETIVFLHHQAVAEQAFYRLQFDLDQQRYQIGIMRPESDVDPDLADFAVEAGNLSLELAAFLNPSLGGEQTVIPPPLFPSLAEPVALPQGMRIQEVRTMRGLEKEGTPYLLFSPRGFSEFGVIHLTLSSGQPLTILVNPFTGNTEIFREDRDFQWTYGRNKKNT